MSAFPIYLMKSGFLLFRPKVDDLRPCIFQDEIVTSFCSIVSSVVLVWFGLDHHSRAEHVEHLIHTSKVAGWGLGRCNSGGLGLLLCSRPGHIVVEISCITKSQESKPHTRQSYHKVHL